MADYKIDKTFGRNVSDPNFKINTSINNWALRSIQRLNEKAGGLVYNNNHPFISKNREAIENHAKEEGHFDADF